MIISRRGCDFVASMWGHYHEVHALCATQEGRTPPSNLAPTLADQVDQAPQTSGHCTPARPTGQVPTKLTCPQSIFDGMLPSCLHFAVYVNGTAFCGVTGHAQSVSGHVLAVTPSHILARLTSGINRFEHAPCLRLTLHLRPLQSYEICVTVLTGLGTWQCTAPQNVPRAPKLQRQPSYVLCECCTLYSTHCT